ncbi:hypothetical protein GBAR_LOCUS29976 [Geodia barretti]|uniref:Uncharacterized protein n=1 Tax=Geodia barretti TaxID=519541 RepID=A0AA35TXN2_GEOBA|nr:hypothetical protein GBAR_LOCUS29976 [Geodia barretti]
MSDQLGIEDFTEVQEALWAARSKWHNIGTRLKLDVHELENIEAEGGMGLDMKFNLMIKTKLKKIEPCTWRDLYDALNHPTVAMSDVANKLSAKLTTAEVPNTRAGDAALSMSSTSLTVANTSFDGGDTKDQEVKITKGRIYKLQREYIDLSVCASKEMVKKYAVKMLRFSLLSLPYNLKKEHRRFLTEAKAEIKQAESAEDIIEVIVEHYNYLDYTLLKYVVDLYGSDDLKKKMDKYENNIKAFRKETRLEIFSYVCADHEPETVGGKFTTMVSMHHMDWRTATLEDVEKFRIQVCREMSLYDFALNCMKLARGCVSVLTTVKESGIGGFYETPFLLSLDQEVKITKGRIYKLQREYIDLSVCASKEMVKKYAVKMLRFSLLSLPSHLKKEHRRFLTEAKAEIKQAESAEDIIEVIVEHYNYLDYTLLKYVVDLYGSDDIKKKMDKYENNIKAFRKETRLEIFSYVCADHEPETVDGRFTVMVSKHDMDWRTATLEDVEKFRIQVCREMSLYDFTLNLIKMARGGVSVLTTVKESGIGGFSQTPAIETSELQCDPVVHAVDDDSLVYTGRAFSYTSTTGIGLFFPAGECKKHVNISVAVANDDYILPSGCDEMPIVSDMYKITTSDKLPVPVTIRMNHCAVMEEEDSQVFIVAHGSPPYQFNLLYGGIFPPYQTYGEIELKNFSILTILAHKLGWRMSLSAQVLYHKNNAAATFVVTKNTPSLIRAVQKQYSDAVAESSNPILCDYTTRAISLSIPDEPQVGWIVVPDFNPPQILTQLIREYREGKTLPCIQLNVKSTGQGKPKEEELKIGVEGCSIKSFTLFSKHLFPSSIATQLQSQHQPLGLGLQSTASPVTTVFSLFKCPLSA